MTVPVDEYGRAIHIALRDVRRDSGSDKARATENGTAWAWTMPERSGRM